MIWFAPRSKSFLSVYKPAKSFNEGSWWMGGNAGKWTIAFHWLLTFNFEERADTIHCTATHVCMCASVFCQHDALTQRHAKDSVVMNAESKDLQLFSG